MFFRESDKLLSEHPLLAREIAAIDAQFGTAGVSAMYTIKTLATATGCDLARVQSLLEEYVSSSVLIPSQHTKCYRCDTYRDASDAECNDCGAAPNALDRRETVFMFTDRVRAYVADLRASSVKAPFVPSRRRGESMPKNIFASDEDLEFARIEPWVFLRPEEYVIESEQIQSHQYADIQRRLERYGLAMLRLSGFGPTSEIMSEIADAIGIPTDGQNTYEGRVKRITPTKESQPNSGDSKAELGPHVDGTQDEDQPAILMFQYVVNAEAGAKSRFWDMAQVLLEYDVAERDALIEKLSARDAAVFSKPSGTYTGPIVEKKTPVSAGIRFRVDDVLSVRPDLKSDVDRIKTRLEARGLEYSPRKGDIIVFDNWRLQHGRSAVLGEDIRSHHRIWIQSLHPELRSKVLLGYRPLTPANQIVLEKNRKP